MAITNTYRVEAGNSGLAYEFISEGPNGNIKKRVEFTPYFEGSTIYNLRFGDWCDNGDIDDEVVTNNLDTEKVLATVGMCVMLFFKIYPNYSIVFMGGRQRTHTRNRLCRMALSKFLEQLEQELEIRGNQNDEWETFVKGNDYDAFIIKRKNH